MNKFSVWNSRDGQSYKQAVKRLNYGEATALANSFAAGNLFAQVRNDKTGKVIDHYTPRDRRVR